jgi:hypothetical protein
MEFTEPDFRERQLYDLSDTIETVYRTIDSEIGEMLAIVDEQPRVLVLSPEGMGPMYHASWNLNEILDLLGFNGQRPTPSQQRSGKVNPWRIIKMVVPSDLQYQIKEHLPKSLQDRLLFLWYAGGRSYAGRRVFAVQTITMRVPSASVSSEETMEVWFILERNTGTFVTRSPRQCIN